MESFDAKVQVYYVDICAFGGVVSKFLLFMNAVLLSTSLAQDPPQAKAPSYTLTRASEPVLASAQRDSRK
jgi:hypothetical protein